MHEDTPNLGQCCSCHKEGPDVRNLIALDFKAPKLPGTVWGCFQCGLPNEGATAVLCDDCLDSGDIKYIIVGYAHDNIRIEYEPYAKEADKHEHDHSQHPEMWSPTDL